MTLNISSFVNETFYSQKMDELPLGKSYPVKVQAFNISWIMQKQLESSESKYFEVLPPEDYGMKFLTAIVENGRNDLFLC